MLDKFPAPILLNIFSFISEKQNIGIVSKVNKKFNDLSYQKKLHIKYDLFLFSNEMAKELFTALESERKLVIRYLIATDLIYDRSKDDADLLPFDDNDLYDSFFFTSEELLERIKKDPNEVNKFYEIAIKRKGYVKEREIKFETILNSLLTPNYYNKTNLKFITDNSIDSLEYINSCYITPDLKEGATLDNMKSMYFFETMKAICAVNGMNLAKLILKNNSSLINFTLPMGYMWSLLGNATHFLRDEMVVLLLEQGSDPNQKFEFIDSYNSEEFQSCPLFMSTAIMLQLDDVEKPRAMNIIISLLKKGAKPLAQEDIDKISSSGWVIPEDLLTLIKSQPSEMAPRN